MEKIKSMVFYLGFTMPEAERQIVRTALLSNYDGRPAVNNGGILCHICFTGCLKKGREMFEKVLNIAKPALY